MGGLHAWHRAPNLNFTGTPDLPLPITRAIHSQNTIGWFSLLNGFVSMEWIAIQDRHCKSITSRRTGRRWAIDFIQELWSISFALWMHRNDRLHNSPKIDELLGLEPLRTAAVRELRRGPENLPDIYHIYFQLTMLELLIKTTLDLRGWFALIKLARETSGTDLHDQFSMNGPLRKWIGLPHKA